MSDRMSVDELCALLSADTFRDVGIYPKAIRGFGDEDYEERTQYQEGWNAACLEIARSDESVIGLVKAKLMALKAENERLREEVRRQYLTGLTDAAQEAARITSNHRDFDGSLRRAAGMIEQGIRQLAALAALDTKSAVE